MINSPRRLALLPLRNKFEHSINHGVTKSKCGCGKRIEYGWVHITVVAGFLCYDEIIVLHVINSQYGWKILSVNNILHFCANDSSCLLIQYFVLKHIIKTYSIILTPASVVETKPLYTYQLNYFFRRIIYRSYNLDLSAIVLYVKRYVPFLNIQYLLQSNVLHTYSILTHTRLGIFYKY